MTTRQATAQDLQEMAEAIRQLRENGWDDFTQQGSQRNADLLVEYFDQNPATPITVVTIFQAVEARKNDFKWVPKSAVEYFKVASEHPQAAAALETWYGNQRHLVNDKEDQRYQNLASLLVELRGREINPTTIAQAEGRIGYKPGRKLHYVPAPRKVSAAQHQDDGTKFVTDGLTVQKDGSLGKSPLDYKREARKRSEENAPSPDNSLSIAQAEAKKECGLMRGNTHGATAAIQRMYVFKPGTTDVDWIGTRNARQQAMASRSVR